MNRPGTVVCLGELLIDFVPGQPGVSVREATGFIKSAGGAPANVAAVIARLGGRSVFIGRVGTDPFGDWLRAQLAETGTDTSHLISDPAAATSLAFVSLAADAGRDFMFYRDGTADTRLQPEDIPDSVLVNAAALHVCSVSLSTGPARTATLHAIRRARELGVPVSFDINWREPLWPDPAEALPVIREALSQADIIKLSEDELTFLTGHSGPEAARELLDGPARLVVLSRGADGLVMLTRRGALEVAGIRVNAVDTTGAGDALAGGLLYALAADPALPDSDSALLAAAERANILAALSTTRPGAMPSYPTAGELAEFSATLQHSHS